MLLNLHDPLSVAVSGVVPIRPTILTSRLNLDLSSRKIGLSFLSLWTIPRRLFGVVSARESIHRDRRQVPSGPSSLSVYSPQGAFHE